MVASLAITTYTTLNIDPFPLDLSILNGALRSLTSLTLQRWFLPPSFLTPVHFPKLTHLCIISEKAAETGTLNQFTRLKSLTLRFYTEKVFETLSTTLTQLENLNIGNLSEVKENDTIEYTSSNGRELSDTSAHHLGKMTNLRRLSLCGLRITDESLVHLTSLVRLQFLDLTYCLKITDEGLNKLTRLTNLMHLELWKTKITDENVNKFVEKKSTTWNKSRLLKTFDS